MRKIKIAVLNDIWLLPEAESKLQKCAMNKLTFPKESDVSEKELIRRTDNAEAVLFSPYCKITQSYLDACPSVKYLGLCGTSITNVDENAVEKLDITLTNIVDYGDEPAAEYMFMQLLRLVRGDGKYQWRKFPCELMGKKIGIIGLGALGKSVANLSLGFKMSVSYYSLHRKKDWESRGVKYKTKNELLKTCEILVITTPSDVKVLGKSDFSEIKSNTILVYLSGGEALDVSSFNKWIKKNDNYAIFNYSAGENYYKLFSKLPKVIFPKVIAGLSIETKERLGERVIENLKEYMLTRK